MFLLRRKYDTFLLWLFPFIHSCEASTSSLLSTTKTGRNQLLKFIKYAFRIRSARHKHILWCSVEYTVDVICGMRAEIQYVCWYTRADTCHIRRTIFVSVIMKFMEFFFFIFVPFSNKQFFFVPFSGSALLENVFLFQFSYIKIRNEIYLTRHLEFNQLTNSHYL